VVKTVVEREQVAMDAAGFSRHSAGTALTVAIAAGVMVAHSALVFRYLAVWWGDSGLWLYMVERIANGDAAYRDVYITAPPLAFWLLGGFARLAGTDVGPVLTATSAVAVAAAMVYGWLVARVAPWPWAALAAVGGLLTAAGLAGNLPMGAYTPAVTMGGLWLLAATLLTVVVLQRGRATPLLGIGVGVLAGCCVLTKQDFWIPAIFLVTVVVVRGAGAWTLTAFVLTSVAGFGAIAWTAGPNAVAGVITGFGQARVAGFTRALPSWSRLTIDVALASGLGGTWLFLAGSKSNERIRWGLIGALMLLAITLAALYRQLSPELLMRDVSWRMFPLVLPVFVLAALVFQWPSLEPRTRTLAVTLLTLCVLARVRRGFEFTDWYHVLLEVPAYLVACRTRYAEQSRRPVMAVVVVLLAAGIWSYWYGSLGPFTRRGAYPAAETLRGTVRWRANEIADYERIGDVLLQLDPERRSPVFAFGQNAGVNYFLRYPNGTPLQMGFSFLSSDRPGYSTPERAVQTLRTLPLILIYHRSYEGEQTAAGMALDSWDQPTKLNHYMAHDLRYFEALREGCSVTATLPGAFFTIYDCRSR
jgi:hypothetical protein